MGSISRTSSTCSIDYTANAFNSAEQRRTRKRITASQLTHLEELYQEASHPTREQRDALARRIQMETKSVTIWFQNKRQTDRKVALHNATNSRNDISANASTSSPTPNITITAPTSPSAGQESNPRPLPDDATHKHPVLHPNPLKRTLSYASSISSSSTSSSRPRPSLDRVASRSEIRFTEKSEKHHFPRTVSASAIPLSRSSSHSALLPRTLPGLIARHPSPSMPRLVSPPPSSTLGLWSHMLSSPIAPSSPPPADIVAYARTRKTRTLDWACAVARVSGEDDVPSVLTSAPHPQPRRSKLGSSFPHHSRVDVAACVREYEEATAMTEDEAELVTPQSSQDVSMTWSTDQNEDETSPFSRADSTLKPRHMISLVDEKPTAGPMDINQWQEDEMHAALALCGLRG